MVIKEVKSKRTEFIIQAGRMGSNTSLGHLDDCGPSRRFWRDFKQLPRELRLEELERNMEKRKEKDKSKDWLSE